MSGGISRRDFVKSAALLSGVVAGAGAQSAVAGEFTGKIRKALKWEMIDHKGSILDKFKLVKDFGFEGVEPTAGSVAKLDIKEMANASEKTGVQVHGVVQGWTFEGIETACDYAKTLGATSVLIVTGTVGEDNPYADNYRVTQEKMRAAIPYYEKNGIYLLVENVWNNFQLSPLEMARYIDELDSEYVKSYFDIGNCMRFGWPEHWIPALGKRIHKLDVKEYSRDKQNSEGPWKGFEVEIGDGSIDWKAVRRELTTIDYSGWATAEVRGGGEDRLRDISQRMDRVFDL